MPLLAEIMDRYLYAEDVKRLAWEHDLPTSRTKDELIGELVASGDLEPEEVVAFIRVDGLREICQDLGLPSGASREVLAERVVEAIGAEMRPRPRRPRRKSKSASEPEPTLASTALPSGPPAMADIARGTDPRAAHLHPVSQTATHPSTDTDNRVGTGKRSTPPSVQYPTPINLRVTLPPVNPPAVHVYVPEVSRAGWAFAGVILTIVIAATGPLAIYAFGLIVGAVVLLIAGVATGAMLLLTAKRWEPWISAIAQGGR
jgi:hypothetical protein